MSKRKGYVLYCSDDQGQAQLRVAMYSLLKTAESDRELDIRVFTGVNPLTPEHVAELQAQVARYPFATLQVINVDAMLNRYREVFENPRARWVIMTWARAFAGEFMAEADQVVYMDIDTFVCHNLAELYDLELGESVLAAVYEDARGDGRAEYYWSRLAAPDAQRYFNGGILVLNLRRFREERLLEKIAGWYSAHHDEAIRLDQDAFNALFWNRMVRLHPRYNYSDGWCERHLKYARRAEHWRGNPPQEILEAVIAPAIIHFWGPKKPWLWNHRPEGWRYAAAMRELGMLAGPLPGTTFVRRLESGLFAVYHGLLRKLAAARI